MKFTITKLAMLSAGLASMASLASATTLCVAGSPNVNVAAGGGAVWDPVTGCTLGGLTFSNFSVINTGAPGAIIDLNPAPATGIIGGNDVDLSFSIGGAPNSGSGDLLLFYKITGNINALDTTLQATNDVMGVPGSITITEIGCSVAFATTTSGCTGITYANYATTSFNGAFVSQTCFLTVSGSGCVAPGVFESPVFIKKDISFNGATTSEFDNTAFIAGVPEPMTFSLMGAGLLAMGLVGRRLRK